MLRFLGRLISPEGPIGEWLSPSEVYKSRLGLPIASPHTQRIRLETSAEVEKALAPTRFIAASDASPPKSRVRQVSAFIEEHWKPHYAVSPSTNPYEILKASQTLVGWWVSQHRRSAYCDCTTARFSREGQEYIHQECGRAKKPLTAEQFHEVVQQVQMQPSDAFYVQYAPTIPGNDPVVVDGQVLRSSDGQVVRGGTMIRGRQHHRHLTKDMAFWDTGFVKERDKALAEAASRPVRNVRRALESYAGEYLPMWRPTGMNLRRDRARA